MVNFEQPKHIFVQKRIVAQEVKYTMGTKKHEIRMEKMTHWVENDCDDEQVKTDILGLIGLGTNASEEMEKVVWASMKTRLAKVENSPIDDLKSVDAGKIAFAPLKTDGDELLKKVFDLQGENALFRARGKEGVYAELTFEAFSEDFWATYEGRYSKSQKA